MVRNQRGICQRCWSLWSLLCLLSETPRSPLVRSARGQQLCTAFPATTSKPVLFWTFSPPRRSQQPCRTASPRPRAHGVPADAGDAGQQPQLGSCPTAPQCRRGAEAGLRPAGAVLQSGDGMFPHPSRHPGTAQVSPKRMLYHTNPLAGGSPHAL